ncbi:MAG: DUF1778 domain-containing protein [Hyphomicrobiales bacterium]|nr:DUF1778 domain-containing protein [Hyphomicrobiales bacterium]
MSTQRFTPESKEEAVKQVVDQRLVTLDRERYDAFVKVLENPPAPGPKLKGLLRRVPVWEE